ncbi:MAG TPA: MFS transporter, partial [Nocardioides bacterium]|nr:MFS transporter [Nocardioides sp.]
AADRFSRRTILVTADLLRAVIVLGFLLVDGPDRAWLLYALTAAQFMVSAFFEPARAALVPSVVPADDLLTANVLSSVTWSAMLSLGAAVGGLVAALLGAPAALVIDALSFVISAVLISRLAAPPRPTLHTHAGGWTDLLAG